VTPENFAQTVVEDYNLSSNYHAVITKSIQDQLSDFRAHSGLYDVDSGEPMSSPIMGTGFDLPVDASPKRGPTHLVVGRRSANSRSPLPFEKLDMWSKVRVQNRAYHAPHAVLPA
jgi:hypothetical protein